MLVQSQELWPWMPQATAVGIILMLWYWTAQGRHASFRSGALCVHGERAAKAAHCFAGLLLLVVISPFCKPFIHPLAFGLAAAILTLIREAKDPLRFGFWHHRRLRPMGQVSVLLAGGLLALGTPSGLGAVLAAAVFVFHRHHRGTMLLLRQSHEELDAMSSKIIALQTRVGLLESMSPCGKSAPLTGEHAQTLPAALKVAKAASPLVASGPREHTGDDKQAK